MCVCVCVCVDKQLTISVHRINRTLNINPHAYKSFCYVVASLTFIAVLIVAELYEELISESHTINEKS